MFRRRARAPGALTNNKERAWARCVCVCTTASFGERVLHSAAPQLSRRYRLYSARTAFRGGPSRPEYSGLYSVPDPRPAEAGSARPGWRPDRPFLTPCVSQPGPLNLWAPPDISFECATQCAAKLGEYTPARPGTASGFMPGGMMHIRHTHAHTHTHTHRKHTHTYTLSTHTKHTHTKHTLSTQTKHTKHTHKAH